MSSAATITVRVRSSKGTSRVEVAADSTLLSLRDAVADALSIPNKENVRLCRDIQGSDMLGRGLMNLSLEDAGVAHGALVFVPGRVEELAQGLASASAQSNAPVTSDDPHTVTQQQTQAESFTTHLQHLNGGCASPVRAKHVAPQPSSEPNMSYTQSEYQARNDDDVRAPDAVTRSQLIDADDFIQPYLPISVPTAEVTIDTDTLDAARAAGLTEWELHLQTLAAQDEAYAKSLGVTESATSDFLRARASSFDDLGMLPFDLLDPDLVARYIVDSDESEAGEDDILDQADLERAIRLSMESSAKVRGTEAMVSSSAPTSASADASPPPASVSTRRSVAPNGGSKAPHRHRHSSSHTKSEEANYRQQTVFPDRATARDSSARRTSPELTEDVPEQTVEHVPRRVTPRATETSAVTQARANSRPVIRPSQAYKRSRYSTANSESRRSFDHLGNPPQHAFGSTPTADVQAPLANSRVTSSIPAQAGALRNSSRVRAAVDRSEFTARTAARMPQLGDEPTSNYAMNNRDRRERSKSTPRSGGTAPSVINIRSTPASTIQVHPPTVRSAASDVTQAEPIDTPRSSVERDYKSFLARNESHQVRTLRSRVPIDRNSVRDSTSGYDSHLPPAERASRRRQRISSERALPFHVQPKAEQDDDDFLLHYALRASLIDLSDDGVAESSLAATSIDAKPAASPQPALLYDASDELESEDALVARAIEESLMIAQEQRATLRRVPPAVVAARSSAYTRTSDRGRDPQGRPNAKETSHKRRF